MEYSADLTLDPKNKILFGLYGAGGFAREVLPFAVGYIKSLFKTRVNTNIDIFFMETNPQAQQVNKFPVISEDTFFQIECHERYFNIAIGNSEIREKIAKTCTARGAKPITLISQHTIIYDNNQIDEGAILCAQSIITSNVKIGKFFHLNINSYVAHDCIIGDFVTFAPNVHCNGNVHIHNHAYIGTGAIIKQGTSIKPLTIGEGAIIGMGAVVTKDVAPYTTVIGNPAKPFIKC
jgi:sugar O-acyltransferase (sialic acid O-acetyltransferase NeuD family)